MHFPLKTSPHYQPARKLFHSVAFCLPTNFPYAGLPGSMTANAGMPAAGDGTCMTWHREKAGGTSGRNPTPAAQSNTRWLLYAAHGAQQPGTQCRCLFKTSFELLCTIRTAESVLSTPANLVFLLLSIGESGKGKTPLLFCRGSFAGGGAGAAAAHTGGPAPFGYVAWPLPAGRTQ